jgi:magnesium transporter
VHVLTSVGRDRIAELLEAGHFFWLDLESPADDELAALGELLHLHPLALEDTREFGQRPKLDRYGDAVLLVYYTASVTGDGVPELVEVHLHISGSWIVTVRRAPFGRSTSCTRCSCRRTSRTRTTSSTASSTR